MDSLRYMTKEDLRHYTEDVLKQNKELEEKVDRLIADVDHRDTVIAIKDKRIAGLMDSILHPPIRFEPVTTIYEEVKCIKSDCNCGLILSMAWILCILTLIVIHI